MPFNIGPGELVLVLVIVLIIFGPGKLPDIGSAIGKGVREFRKASTDLEDSIRGEPAATPPAATPPRSDPARSDTAASNRSRGGQGEHRVIQQQRVECRAVRTEVTIPARRPTRARGGSQLRA